MTKISLDVFTLASQRVFLQRWKYYKINWLSKSNYWEGTLKMSVAVFGFISGHDSGNFTLRKSYAQTIVAFIIAH